MSTTTQVRERPILFSGPMIRALLEGRKTQTRRVVKPQPAHPHVFRALNGAEWCDDPGVFLWDAKWEDDDGRHGVFVGEARCPYGQPGDRLWVKEPWWHYSAPYLEQAGFVGGTVTRLGEKVGHWHPNGDFNPADYGIWTKKGPRFMPRWASRITLEITDVRVERLQEITEEDARAEGVAEIGGNFAGCFSAGPHLSGVDARTAFARLWDSLNAPRGYSFESNPWVWALTFRLLPAPQGATEETE